MTSQVLVLNADWTPHDITDPVDALWKVMCDKARLVAGYAGRMIRSFSESFEVPAVIVLTEYHKLPNHRRRVRLACTRWTVIARDHRICQYCGESFPLRQLTQDHVVPKSRRDAQDMVVLPWNGKTVYYESWENLVCACEDCNHTKDNMTPDEAGMALVQLPKVPRGADAARISMRAEAIPAEWETYLFD
jgi:5-methylcytosine-specific restriction endonuclease McrA